MALLFIQISSYSRVYVRLIYKRKAKGKRVKFLWDLLYKLKRSSANVLPVYVARCMTSWKQARSMSLDLNKRIASLRIPRNLIFWFVTEINLEASWRKRLTACGGRPRDQPLSSRLRFLKANFYRREAGFHVCHLPEPASAKFEFRYKSLNSEFS